MDEFKLQRINVATTNLSIAKGATNLATASAAGSIPPAILQQLANHMTDGVISRGELQESRQLLSLAIARNMPAAARAMQRIVNAEENQLHKQGDLARAYASPNRPVGSEAWGNVTTNTGTRSYDGRLIGSAALPEVVVPQDNGFTAGQAIGAALATGVVGAIAYHALNRDERDENRLADKIAARVEADHRRHTGQVRKWQ